MLARLSTGLPKDSSDRPFLPGQLLIHRAPDGCRVVTCSLLQRLNLTRFRGVFAPNFRHRERIVPHRSRGRVDGDKPLAPIC